MTKEIATLLIEGKDVYLTKEEKRRLKELLKEWSK